MASDTTSPVFPNVQLTDPRDAFAKPPFDKQRKTSNPRSTGKMNPTPAREGANVVINYLSEDSDAEATKLLVEEAGVKAVVIRGDLRQESFCEELIEVSIDSLGSLDLLVNNAAYQASGETIDDFSTELFDRIFKTNIYAPFWLSRAAMDRLPAGGRIVNTVTIQGYNPSTGLLPYATTKSALIGMTKALAKLAIERGIRVNAVAPGPVWTPFIPSSMPKEKFENFGADRLFKRPAHCHGGCGGHRESGDGPFLGAFARSNAMFCSRRGGRVRCNGSVPESL